MHNGQSNMRPDANLYSRVVRRALRNFNDVKRVDRWLDTVVAEKAAHQNSR